MTTGLPIFYSTEPYRRPSGSHASTMKPPKDGNVYRSIWRLTWGALKDTAKNHPEYFQPGREYEAIRSACKRVTGSIMGFAEQSARGRSAKAAVDNEEALSASLTQADAHLHAGRASAAVKKQSDKKTGGAGTPPVAYPYSPGFKRPGTSQAAAQHMAHKAPTIQARIMAWFQAVPGRTATVDEIQDALGLTQISARSRTTELGKQGLLVRTGATRALKSGLQGDCWRVKV